MGENHVSEYGIGKFCIHCHLNNINQLIGFFAEQMRSQYQARLLVNYCLQQAVRLL